MVGHLFDQLHVPGAGHWGQVQGHETGQLRVQTCISFVGLDILIAVIVVVLHWPSHN